MVSAAEGPTTVYKVSISGKSSININSELITFEVLLTQGFPSWHFLGMVRLGQSYRVDYTWKLELYTGAVSLYLGIAPATSPRETFCGGSLPTYGKKGSWDKPMLTEAVLGGHRAAQGLFYFSTPYTNSCSKKSNTTLPKGGRKELC